MLGDPTNSPGNKLYLVRWKDGDGTIVTASDNVGKTLDVFVSPKRNRRSSDDLYREVDSIQAIAGFEMRVADDTADSAPMWYRLRLDRKEVEWSRASYRGMTTEEARPPDDASSPSCRIWGYISRDENTVVFTAPDLDAARRRVIDARGLWRIKYLGASRAPRKNVKSIDGFEMVLTRVAEHLVPMSYSVWIGRNSFEWPHPPPDPDDDDRLAAEARLPIPVYSRVSARVPERPRSWTRRTATLETRGASSSGLLNERRSG